MEPDIFFDTFEVSEFTEHLHAIIGRALIIATRFENSVRILSTLLDLKANTYILNSEEDLERLRVAIEKNNLAKNIKNLPISSDKIDSILKNAREGRNYIAHEVAKGFDQPIDFINDENLSDYLLDIHNAVNNIARGDCEISLLISHFTHEQIPTNAFLLEYPEVVAEWVCRRELD